MQVVIATSKIWFERASFRFEGGEEQGRWVVSKIGMWECDSERERFRHSCAENGFGNIIMYLYFYVSVGRGI